MSRMRVFVLTLLAMTAFAGNSLLCRLALKDTSIDAASFTSVRIISGALALWLIARMRGGTHSASGNWLSALALFCMRAAFRSPMSVCRPGRAHCCWRSTGNNDWLRAVGWGASSKAAGCWFHVRIRRPHRPFAARALGPTPAGLCVDAWRWCCLGCLFLARHKLWRCYSHHRGKFLAGCAFCGGAKRSHASLGFAR